MARGTSLISNALSERAHEYSEEGRGLSSNAKGWNDAIETYFQGIFLPQQCRHLCLDQADFLSSKV